SGRARARPRGAAAIHPRRGQGPVQGDPPNLRPCRSDPTLSDSQGAQHHGAIAQVAACLGSLRVATSMGAGRRRQGRKAASQPRPASRTRMVGGRRLDPGRHRRNPHRHAAWIAEGAAALARLYQHHRECHEHGAARMPKREAMALGLDGDALDRGRDAGSGQRLPTTEGSQAASNVAGRSGSSPQQRLTRCPCSPSHRRLTSISAATASQCSTKRRDTPCNVISLWSRGLDDIVSLVRKRLTWKITDQDKISRPKTLKPALNSRLGGDEESLGFRLPPVPKRIYTEIGNGGFGPGYGLIGMSSGAPDSTGKTAPEIYRILRSNDPQDPLWSWPDCLLPICEWGCAIMSCVDCAVPDFPVRIFDPNIHCDNKSWDDSFFEQAESFEAWIKAWADGNGLWEELYGENGRIAHILNERKQAI